MLRYLFFRIAQSLLLLIGVLALVFLMVRLTGDPAALMLSREATPEQLEAFRELNGMNRPVMVQLLDYFAGILRGDLGDSMQMDLPNSDLISQRLPATLELATTALLLALVVALPLGILSGMSPGTFVDYIARGLGLAGQTIPSFWLAMILILVVAVNVPWIPTFGRDGVNSLILPASALGLAGMGQLVRLTRSVVLEVRSENYIRTARAKGLHPYKVAWRHIMPNVAIPLVSVIGIQYTYLLGGSIYIETVFAWPGLGGLLNDAVNGSDFPLIQAITIFIGIFAIAVNLLTDIVYSLLDPRIRQI
jgi:ABC-type dipeptide/oligopeptide/nickel transport system permease component